MGAKDKIGLGFLALSFLLQLAADVTPGWHILTYQGTLPFAAETDNRTYDVIEYKSLFYYVVCKRDTDENCDVISAHDSHRRQLNNFDNADDNDNRRIQVREYEYLVRCQCEAVVALALTIHAIVCGSIRLRGRKTRPIWAVIQVVTVILAFTLVVEVVGYASITLRYFRSDDAIGTDQFPYSILIQGVAALTLLIAVIILIVNILSSHVGGREPRKVLGMNTLGYSERHDQGFNQRNVQYFNQGSVKGPGVNIYIA